MATNYLTREELKATAELTGQTFADNDIDLAIGAASRTVEQITGRRFYPDADAAQVRYFTAKSTELVDVGDLLVLTTLTFDRDADNVYEDDWTALTARWMLEPRNILDGYPWQQLRTRGSYEFPTAPSAVKITGKFGWLVAPEQVKEATVLIANRLLKRAREAPFGVANVGIDQVGVRVARSDPDVDLLLRPLSRLVYAA